jgi:hypothetical protein
MTWTRIKIRQEAKAERVARTPAPDEKSALAIRQNERPEYPAQQKKHRP